MIARRLALVSLLSTLTLACALSGCGGDDDGGDPVECTMAYTGGVTGQVGCTAVAVYDEATDKTSISILGKAAGEITNASLSIELSGRLSKGTFSHDTATSASGTVRTAAATWLGTKTTAGAAVSFTVTANAVLSGDVYTAHGTATASLPHVGGTMPAAMVAVTF